MKTTLGQLHRWIIGSKLTADASFDGVSTDTRLAGAGNLFVALKGDNFDAHDFLADLPKKALRLWWQKGFRKIISCLR